MGPGNAKLLDLATIRRSLINNADRIRALEGHRLSTLRASSVPQVSRDVWAVLSNLKVSRARAFMVANSKALHHVLPSLVPPIDRQYTLDFFFGSTTIDGREEAAFAVMFPHFYEIASAKADVIRGWVRRESWHTSETKVIDNAIVGYWS
jgi:hypothetical protein